MGWVEASGSKISPVHPGTPWSVIIIPLWHTPCIFPPVFSFCCNYVGKWGRKLWVPTFHLSVNICRAYHSLRKTPLSTLSNHHKLMIANIRGCYGLCDNSIITFTHTLLSLIFLEEYFKPLPLSSNILHHIPHLHFHLMALFWWENWHSQLQTPIAPSNTSICTCNFIISLSSPPAALDQNSMLLDEIKVWCALYFLSSCWLFFQQYTLFSLVFLSFTNTSFLLARKYALFFQYSKEYRFSI